MTKRILEQWDQSIDDAQRQRLDRLLQRRQFLLNSLKATTGIALLGMGLHGCDQPQQVSVSTTPLQQHPWPTLALVHLILFPADGNGPSAHDIHSTAYLHFALHAAGTDPEDRGFILKGVEWLDKLSRDTHSGRNFMQVTAAQQAKLIHQINQSAAGERWLSLLLLYLFEALLSDPVYGGNPDGIGWAWLQHQAGFPSPTPDKTWPELLKR